MNRRQNQKVMLHQSEKKMGLEPWWMTGMVKKIRKGAMMLRRKVEEVH